MAVQSTIYHGPSTAFTRDPERRIHTPSGEVDRIEQDWDVPFSGYEAALTAQSVTIDAAYPGHTKMFVEGFSRVEQDGESRGIVTVQVIGMLDATSDKRRRRMSAFGRIIAVGPIEEVAGEPSFETIVTGTGSAERWNINDPSVAVVDTYLTTTAPNMTQIGTAQTPPSAPTVPTWKWGSYTQPLRYNDPNGWVLDGRDPEELIPSALWRVTDTFVYYYNSEPD